MSDFQEIDNVMELQDVIFSFTVTPVEEIALD
jgi:hypothetical protein